MGTKGYCIENDRAAQMELAEMERHNSLLIWEENKALRARVTRLEEFVKKAKIAFDEIGAVNWSRRARRTLEGK